MKKKNGMGSKIPGMLCIAAMGLVASCQKEETALVTESDYVVEESLTDSYFEDTDDMSGEVMIGASETNTGVAGGKIGNTGGRTITVNDARLACATITVTVAENSTQDHPRGSIVIDFGTGCEGPAGNTRKGTISISFDGRRFMPGAMITETFQDYYINDVHLEGTRTVTNKSTSSQDSPVFEITLTGGKVTWPDNTSATREHDFTRTWVVSSGEIQETGSASGVNRRGKSYDMTIDQTLVYHLLCPIAVSGVKTFETEGSTITIDYGAGDCDRSVTITVNGRQRDVNVNG